MKDLLSLLLVVAMILMMVMTGTRAEGGQF
jgi:hypothetical protein